MVLLHVLFLLGTGSLRGPMACKVTVTPGRKPDAAVWTQRALTAPWAGIILSGKWGWEVDCPEGKEEPASVVCVWGLGLWI